MLGLTQGTKTMKDLFEAELQDTYSAETQLVKALPKMAKNANNAELRSAFEQHLTETQNQISRLEQVGQKLGIKMTSNTCEAMEGLVEEGEEVIKEGYEADVLDAALIASAQKVEHYEIASYGTLCAFAKQLGHQDIASLLHQSLEEERRTDEKLTRLAESRVNTQATKA
jgi:ferritin-like metal-binding protein YciE